MSISFEPPSQALPDSCSQICLKLSYYCLISCSNLPQCYSHQICCICVSGKLLEHHSRFLDAAASAAPAVLLQHCLFSRVLSVRSGISFPQDTLITIRVHMNVFCFNPHLRIFSSSLFSFWFLLSLLAGSWSCLGDSIIC